MHGIYNYIPETNNVPRAVCATCNVISHVENFVISSQYFPHFVSGVQHGFFLCSLISCFLGMLLRYCRSVFEIVPVAPVVIDTTFALLLLLLCFYHLYAGYLQLHT